MEKGKLEKANEPNICACNKLLDHFNAEFPIVIYIVLWGILIFFSIQDHPSGNQRRQITYRRESEKVQKYWVMYGDSVRIKYLVNYNNTNC